MWEQFQINLLHIHRELVDNHPPITSTADSTVADLKQNNLNLRQFTANKLKTDWAGLIPDVTGDGVWHGKSPAPEGG